MNKLNMLNDEIYMMHLNGVYRQQWIEVPSTDPATHYTSHL